MKGVSVIVASTLIIVISITVVYIALRMGSPAIDRTNEIMTMENSEAFMDLPWSEFASSMIVPSSAGAPTSFYWEPSIPLSQRRSICRPSFSALYQRERQ